MLSQNVVDRFNQLINDTLPERSAVRELNEKGKWREAEPDKKRKVSFALKEEIKNDRNGAETQVGDTLDWVDVSFFTEGDIVKRAVAYITVISGRSIKTGSGFMISDTLFMTNNHVILDMAEAKGAVITFNKEIGLNGQPLATTIFRLDPDKFFEFSPQTELDYSIISLGPKVSGELNPGDFGYFILSDTPDRHVIGMNVNIIQHPLDLPKVVTFRKNLLTFRTNNTLLYETDTDTGSSGSPICNDDWDLVALHHWGQPYRAKMENPESNMPNYVNEGIRISSIYNDLTVKSAALEGDQKKLLLEALSFAKLQPSIKKKMPAKRPPGEPVPSTGESNTPLKNVNDQPQIPLNKLINQNQVTMANNTNEITFTIPIEITLRVGGAVSQVSPQKELPVSKKNLVPGAEVNKIDTDYSNRSGYVPGFIPGFQIPLPVIENRENIAPLKTTEPNHTEGVLKYEHFSLILNIKYRSAFFTATNIDGESFMSVNRKTGEVTPRSEMNLEEGETWYNDDRIDPKYHLNQPFFSGWSTYFDRGHLTRRTDPAWGTEKIALRADADTFHFSNCSIQHFRFNQTLPYWQGAERYVLENGFLKAGIENRLTVFQGPIYDSQIDLWADDFQIPSKFFKIAVWNSSVKGLQAVGLIVDQLPLLNEERKSLGQPRDVASVNVNQWRVSIKKIEEMAGLDFGEDVRNADTIRNTVQPEVGAEAAIKIPIQSWEDLLK